MHKYFVAKDGIQKGPWSLEEINENIQDKNLSWNDYIYDERLNNWVFLFEFPALTESFNKSFKTPIQKFKNISSFDFFKDRVWYILKQNENYGPFTGPEMIQMLQSKTLFEYDFVWRPGQASWQRLADIEDYSPEKIKEIYEISAINEARYKTFFRRRHPRSHYKCELLVHNESKVFSAESIEISFGGASFNLHGVDFPLDSQVYLHFKPGNDVPAFNATCKVVSRNGIKYGVSFSHISSHAQDSIAKFTKKAA
jgi:hypothetical protein